MCLLFAVFQWYFGIVIRLHLSLVFFVKLVIFLSTIDVLSQESAQSAKFAISRLGRSISLPADGWNLKMRP